ncbi:MAG TPA: hypothetical protein VG455_10580 [Acidimicrobiales bacterium]|nr:hypothetical protein [Acidimicrobiales bacterium]
MKGKWAAGIVPRNFAWIIRDRLAVCERPGGYARSHRPVRRQEEIIWIREQGFSRVVSLLASPHNLHSYDELGVAWEHIAFGAHDDPRTVLAELLPKLRGWQAAGEKLLVHQEELGDRVQGVAGGYLVYSGLVPDPAQSISIVEQICQRQMGPLGRQLVGTAAELAAEAAGGAPR